MNTESAHRPSGVRPYFPSLDGVRAIAALMVMVFHYSQLGNQSHLLVIGQTGVDLFFVLSGFLITTILLNAPSRSWHAVRNFYIRRTLRIFPLYYCFLIGAAIFGTVSTCYWFYLQNIAMSLQIPTFGPEHFWSLAVEEHFYLFWPFLVLFLPRRRLGAAMWGILLLSTVCRAVLAYTHVDVFYLTITRLDGLAAGGLIALANNRGYLQRFRGLLTALGLVSLVLLVTMVMHTHGKALPIAQILKPTFTTGLYSSAIALLITMEGTFAQKALSSKPLRAIGKVSYGLYVYHPTVFHWLSGRLGNLPVSVKEPLSFLAAYIVAWLSWILFESRFVGLKDRLAPERRFKTADHSDVKPLVA